MIMRKLLPFICLVCLLQGCATTYPVRFNGYLAPEAQRAALLAPGRCFHVLEEEKAANQLLSAEIRSKMMELLKEKGYCLEGQPEAEYLVEFSYSINPGTVSGWRPENYPLESGTIRTYTEDGQLRTSYITLPGYTSYVPYRYTVYASRLQITVYDAREPAGDKGRKPLWIGESLITSQNPDLRETVNYLLIAAFERFGQDTRKSVTTTIPATDPRVRQLLD